MSDLEKFISYLKARALTEQSIKRYEQVVKSFLKSSKGYDRESVLSFLASLREKGYSGTYQRWVFSVLKSFFNSIGIEFPLSKKDLPKAEEPKRPYFTVDEVKRLLEVVKKSGNLRDYLIMRLSALLGLRRIELSMLNRSDVDLEGKKIFIRTRKRGKPRVRILDEETASLLKLYLDSRKDEEEALFISERGGRISLRELSWMMMKYAKMAGVWKKGVGYHAFRRGLVTALHKRGISIRELQDLLGWKTLQMASEYIRLEPSEIEEKVRKVHPLLE